MVNVTFLAGDGPERMPKVLTLPGYVGDVLIYSGLQLFVCYKSFHLTWEVPNFIMSLIGQQSGSDLGENEGKTMAMGIAQQSGMGAAGAAMTAVGGDNKPSEDPKEKPAVEGEG